MPKKSWPISYSNLQYKMGKTSWKYRSNHKIACIDKHTLKAYTFMSNTPAKHATPEAHIMCHIGFTVSSENITLL